MTEPIIAYRSWSISASKRQIKSTGNGVRAWARLSAPAAQCVSDGMLSSYYSIMSMMTRYLGSAIESKDEQEHHEAPSFTCKCGYYAMKRVQDIPTGGEVYGRVALWGRIIEHDHGYRAQYAYPQVLFAPPDASEKFLETLKGLAQQYGCEIAPMPQELTDELAKREKEAEESLKRQSSWIIDSTPSPGGYWGYSVYDMAERIRSRAVQEKCADDPVDPERAKIEKGFASKTKAHPFKSFMGGYVPPHRRK